MCVALGITGCARRQTQPQLRHCSTATSLFACLHPPSLPTQAARDKADSSDPGSVGAPMAGEIIEVKAKPGSFVKAGQVGGLMPVGCHLAPFTHACRRFRPTPLCWHHVCALAWDTHLCLELGAGSGAFLPSS